MTTARQRIKLPDVETVVGVVGNGFVDQRLFRLFDLRNKNTFDFASLLLKSPLLLLLFSFFSTRI